MTGPPATLFSPLYESRPQDYLGDGYEPPSSFTHGEETLVGTFTGMRGAAMLYECRMPTRAFTVIWKPKNQGKDNLCFGTGTGQKMGEMALQIAKALPQDMLVIERHKEDAHG